MEYNAWLQWVEKVKATAEIVAETHEEAKDGAWEHTIVARGPSGETKVQLRYWPRDENAGADLSGKDAPLAFRVGELINRVQCWRRADATSPWESLPASAIGGGLHE